MRRHASARNSARDVSDLRAVAGELKDAALVAEHLMDSLLDIGDGAVLDADERAVLLRLGNDAKRLGARMRAITRRRGFLTRPLVIRGKGAVQTNNQNDLNAEPTVAAGAMSAGNSACNKTGGAS